MMENTHQAEMEVQLGQDRFVEGSPKLSLVATKNLCNGIRSHGESSSVSNGNVVMVSKFLRERGALEASATFFPDRKLTMEMVEHFDAVTFFKKNDNFLDAVEFSFLIDNREVNQYAVAYIYSLQDEEMVFDGFAVRPGEESRLERYRTVERTFRLTANPAVLEEGASERTARHIFEDVQKNKKRVCAFSIVLTRAKVPMPRGLLVETDGISTDGPSLTTKKQHYTNLVKGSESKQRFTPVNLEYEEDAPVHIYNVVLFME